MNTVIPASCTLNKAFITRVAQPIYTVWNAIGADVYDAVGACGEEDLDNAGAIECCIDADRLHIHGNDKEANMLIREQCRIHGYTKVLKYLSKHIHLV